MINEKISVYESKLQNLAENYEIAVQKLVEMERARSTVPTN